MRGLCSALVGALLLSAGCRPAPPRAVPVDEHAWQPVALVGPEGTGQGRLYAAGGVRRPALVVVHGDFGLTEPIDANARRLASLGYVVLALDLYRGEKVGTLLEAHILDRGLPEERVKADLRAAVDHLAGLPEVDAEAIGIVGFDMGGGYALDTAVRDRRLRAVVTCYGRLTTDAALLKPMRAAVLCLCAGKDEGNPPETREAFQAAMRAAGKRLDGPHVFAAADHGFLNPPPEPGEAPPDRAAVAEAWRRIERFLAAELTRGGKSS